MYIYIYIYIYICIYIFVFSMPLPAGEASQGAGREGGRPARSKRRARSWSCQTSCHTPAPFGRYDSSVAGGRLVCIPYHLAHGHTDSGNPINPARSGIWPPPPKICNTANYIYIYIYTHTHIVHIILRIYIYIYTYT